MIEINSTSVIAEHKILRSYSAILDAVLKGEEPTFTEPPGIVKKHAKTRQKIRDRLGIKEEEVLCGLEKGF